MKEKEFRLFCKKNNHYCGCGESCIGDVEVVGNINQNPELVEK